MADWKTGREAERHPQKLLSCVIWQLRKGHLPTNIQAIWRISDVRPTTTDPISICSKNLLSLRSNQKDLHQGEWGANLLCWVFEVARSPIASGSIIGSEVINSDFAGIPRLGLEAVLNPVFSSLESKLEGMQLLSTIVDKGVEIAERRGDSEQQKINRGRAKSYRGHNSMKILQQQKRSPIF